MSDSRHVRGLHATNLSWSIRGKRIVDDVSLGVATGELLGLLGPNGSGKTSLLRLLAGLRTPDSGTVTLDGMDLAGIRPRELSRRLAVVEQEAGSPADLRLDEVVALGRTPFRGRFDGLSRRDEDAVTAALRLTGLTHKRHAAWDTLSGGERQRGQLARALAQEPTEIVLDEPTNHLDIHHQLEILFTIKELRLTAVAALHDLNLAAQFCDRIAILDAGRLVAIGSPEDVLTSERIRAVYGVTAHVDRTPVDGRVRLTYSADRPPTGFGERSPSETGVAQRATETLGPTR